ncbi:MAG: hypothetical protein IT183_13000 [Acidobacteria bacterium]|nr:hypothetical protein [Acidobacteriota bacterium]
MSLPMLAACDVGARWVHAAGQAAEAARDEPPERRAGQLNRSLTPDEFRPDPQASAERRAATLAWYRRALRGSYEQVGSRQPRWDRDTLRALDILATRYALVPDRPGDLWDQARVLLRPAVAGGVDDPLVRLLAAELLRHDHDRRTAAAGIRNAAIALERSAYPAYWRGYGLISAASALLETGRGTSPEEWAPIWREICNLLDRALTLYPAVLDDQEIPDGVALTYINWLASTFVAATKRDRSVIEGPAVDAVLAARPDDDPLVHLLRGWFAVHAAWDARGTDFARNVQDHAWPEFYTRLAQAEVHAAAAVRAGSIEPAVPAIMMRVGLGLHGDSEELDRWFAHAVAIEPGDRFWYEAKLDWLLPKWFGSREEVLVFARETARGGNWGLRLPFLVEDAWRGLSGGEVPPEACEEILAIHAAFAEDYPDSPTARAQRQTLAEACGADRR